MSTRDLPEQIGDLPRIGRPANSALLTIGVTTLAEVAAAGRGGERRVIVGRPTPDGPGFPRHQAAARFRWCRG